MAKSPKSWFIRPSLTSNAAQLVVDADLTPPTVVSADRDFSDATQVAVVFSEPVSTVTATTVSNYTINNSVTVSNAVMGADAKTVLLTTSGLNAGGTYI